MRQTPALGLSRSLHRTGTLVASVAEVTIAVCAISAATEQVAREGVLTMINPAMSSPTSTPSSNRFWTVERMRQARPIPLPMVVAPQLATPALLQPSPDRQSRDAVAPAVPPQPMMTPGRLRVERTPEAGPP